MSAVNANSLHNLITAYDTWEIYGSFQEAKRALWTLVLIIQTSLLGPWVHSQNEREISLINKSCETGAFQWRFYFVCIGLLSGVASHISCLLKVLALHITCNIVTWGHVQISIPFLITLLLLLVCWTFPFKWSVRNCWHLFQAGTGNASKASPLSSLFSTRWQSLELADCGGESFPTKNTGTKLSYDQATNAYCIKPLKFQLLLLRLMVLWLIWYHWALVDFFCQPDTNFNVFGKSGS